MCDRSSHTPLHAFLRGTECVIHCAGMYTGLHSDARVGSNTAALVDAWHQQICPVHDVHSFLARAQGGGCPRRRGFCAAGFSYCNGLGLLRGSGPLGQQANERGTDWRTDHNGRVKWSRTHS